MKVFFKKEVTIHAGDALLTGNLWLPPDTTALIVFSHGSGSSRLSPRNRQVAEYLNRAGMGTLLFDLLTEEEDRDYKNRFDIALITRRLSDTVVWLQQLEETMHCRIGFFGASTGAASALTAAAQHPEVAAVVSRGGRPDLSMEWLPKVKAPTLLIVGGNDIDVLRLNEAAYGRLHCTKKLEVVPGATHLFEEYGAMEQVCKLAGNWFRQYLKPVVLYND